MTADLDIPSGGYTRGPIRPWSSLLIRDYRLIFVTILCANTANHMRNVASLYQVYQLSGSSVQLGLAGFFQALPFIIFGLFGGVLADASNRKKLIAITHTCNVLPGLALGILTITGDVQVWHVNASTSLLLLCRCSAARRAKLSSRVSCRSRIFSMRSAWQYC